MKSNAGSGRSPAAKAKSSQGTRGGVPLTEMAKKRKTTQHSRKPSLYHSSILKRPVNIGTSLWSKEWDSVLPMQGMGVRSLVWDLISHLLQLCPHTATVEVYTSTGEPKGHNWRSPQAAIRMEPSQKVKTEKTCKQRARYVRVKTRWGQIKHLKLRRRLS